MSFFLNRWRSVCMYLEKQKSLKSRIDWPIYLYFSQIFSLISNNPFYKDLKKFPSNWILITYSLHFSGTHPSVTDGIVPALGCVVESSEDCCGTQLNLAIKNCSANFMVYHLVPPNTCSIGYCAGHRLPCPEGLTSPSGFTPCECKICI